MKDIIISIITPVYNNEKYVRDSVESVLSQNQDGIEVIIVDDGSTDRTPQIVDEIAGNNENVTVIHQENQWIYASFNNGIKAATGEYIYILNSDDELFDGSLALLKEKIEEYNHPDVIFTRVIDCICDENKNIIKDNIDSYNESVSTELYFETNADLARNWVYLAKNGITRNQANLYKREFALRHPFRNDIYGADAFFNYSIAEEIKSSVLLIEPVYHFFMYNNNNYNASCGKYYSYEHDMFNEDYIEHKKLLNRWNVYDEESKNHLVRFRLKLLTAEIRSLSSHVCPLTVEEKIKEIFCRYVDETMVEVAGGDRREELDARILSGVREILVKTDRESLGEMSFIYDFMESLLRYEKDDNDYNTIRNAIYNSLNPYNVGITFFSHLYDGADKQ